MKVVDVARIAPVAEDEEEDKDVINPLSLLFLIDDDDDGVVDDVILTNVHSDV